MPDAGRGLPARELRTSTVRVIELPMPATVRTVNVYLFEGDELTLVDTGLKTEAALSALVAGLAQLGYELADIDRLVITHAHADHFGLAARIVAESGAYVLAHRSTVARMTDVADLVERMQVFQDRLLHRAGAPERAWLFLTVGLGAYVACAESLPGDAVGELLKDGHAIDLGGMGWRALELPGHADGLICLHQEETGTLISSDLLVPQREYHPLLEPLADASDGRTRPVSGFLSSLARVEGLHVATILARTRTLVSRCRGCCGQPASPLYGSAGTSPPRLGQAYVGVRNLAVDPSREPACRHLPGHPGDRELPGRAAG